MAHRFVKVKVEDYIATLSLTRTESLNALQPRFCQRK